MTTDEMIDWLDNAEWNNGDTRMLGLVGKGLADKLRTLEAKLKAADEFIANFNTEMGLGRLEVVRDGVFEQLEENYRNAGETK